MIQIYTDGACIGNPGPGGWAAIIDVDGQREEISGDDPHTTNNRMELTAVIEALRRVPPTAPVRVVTDSQYVMRGITSWLAGWRRRGWRTATGAPVLNRELWETLAELAGTRVTWEWVRGHAGHPENVRVDALARARAREAQAATRGAATRPHATTARPAEQDSGGNAPLAGGGTAAGGPAAGAAPARAGWPSYLSLVRGELRRHHDWPSCQRHTSGQPGARFKKCRDAAEERATLARWGLSPDRLNGLRSND